MAPHLTLPLSTNWTFRQSSTPEGEDHPFRPVSQFPTNIHLDLLHHALIPDPFLGKNESLVQWVGEARWTYRTTFPTPSSIPEGAKVVLAFDGLDTFATVRLNGEVVLEGENMFLPERVGIEGKLKGDGGENELVIEFDSAYLRGWKEVERSPGHKWGVWNGDSSRLAVRKAQYHWVSSSFGSWDMVGWLLTLGRDGIGVRR